MRSLNLFKGELGSPVMFGMKMLYFFFFTSSREIPNLIALFFASNSWFHLWDLPRYIVCRV